MTPTVRRKFVKKPGRKPVFRYLYVEARAFVNDYELVSFRHIEVKGALSEDQAYELGAELLDVQDTKETNPDTLEYLDESYALNDYVVKL